MSTPANYSLGSEDGGEEDYIASCPGEFAGRTPQFCINEGWKQLDLYPTPQILSILSSTFSLIGTSLIILTYVLWKDIRTGSRKIVTFLSIADFVTAAGYIVGTINFICYKFNVYSASGNTATACIKFDEVCQVQSFISSWSSNSSFLWTLILAFFFYWTIVRGEIVRVTQLFPLYHVVAWLFPLLFMIPLLAMHKFGYSVVAAGGWCFMRSSNNPYQDHPGETSVDYSMSAETVGLFLAGGKFVEITTYVLVAILYFRIWYYIHKEVSSFGVLACENSVHVAFVNMPCV